MRFLPFLQFRHVLALLTLLLPLPLWGQITASIEGSRLSLSLGDKLVTTYRGDTRVPCLYPLHGPGGSNLTRHYPFEADKAGEEKDHPHHVSFWFAHGQVAGHDFWHGKENRIVHQKFSPPEIDQDAQTASFQVELSWQAANREVLKEVRRYHFDLSEKNRYLIETISELTPPLNDVTFGDTKEGSFAIRVAPTLRLTGEQAQGHIFNAEGLEDEDCWGKRSRWVAYSGPDAAGKPAVVCLMDHRQNLRHPTWWHARDYGLLAANPFGQHDFEGRKSEPELGNFTLEKGKTLTQSYLLVLAEGQPDSLDLKAMWKDWSAPKTDKPENR